MSFHVWRRSLNVLLSRVVHAVACDVLCPQQPPLPPILSLICCGCSCLCLFTHLFAVCPLDCELLEGWHSSRLFTAVTPAEHGTCPRAGAHGKFVMDALTDRRKEIALKTLYCIL